MQAINFVMKSLLLLLLCTHTCNGSYACMEASKVMQIIGKRLVHTYCKSHKSQPSIKFHTRHKSYSSHESHAIYEEI